MAFGKRYKHITSNLPWKEMTKSLLEWFARKIIIHGKFKFLSKELCIHTLVLAKYEFNFSAKKAI